MFKRIFSVLLAGAIIGNLSAFAQLSEVDGVYNEDFEGYEEGTDIVADKTLIKEFTKFEPELDENSGSQVMVVNSASGADNIIYTNTALYKNELNIMKFKIGADSSSKLNWGSTSSLIFSHTNGTGIVVNDYLFDFAYSLVRHKENGVTEKAICGFASKKMYNVELQITKQLRDEKYYYDVTYIVDGSKNIVSFQTTADGEMRVGFKSTSGNKLYIDDIEVYGFTLVKTDVNIADRSDVSVKPEIEVVFSDAVDELTLFSGDINVGGIVADTVTLVDENKYNITLSAPLQKNTEYVLDMSAVRDTKGNSLEKSKFSFKTRDTAVVLDNTKIINTSSVDLETVLLGFPAYDESGNMTNKYVSSLEISQNGEIPIGREACFVLTGDYKPVAVTAVVPDTGEKVDEFSALFDTDTQKLRVSGKTTSSFDNELVSVTVTDSTGEVDYIGVSKTVEGGYFSVEYTPASASGLYTVMARTMQEEFVSNVNVRLKDDIKAVLDIVNSKNKADIISAFDTYKDVLLIDLDLYNTLSDKSFISTELAKLEKYEKIEDLIDDIKVLTLVDSIRNIEDKYTVFKNYEDIVLSTADEAYSVWSGLTDADKEAVLDTVIVESIYSPDQFKKNIYIEAILEMIAGTNKYIDAKNAIESYPEILGINLTVYEKINRATSVAKGLCGKKLSIAEFRTKFNALVNNAMNEIIDNGVTLGSPGSGGGGGNGGGGGGYVAMPNATSEPMNTPKPTGAPIAVLDSFSDMNEASWAADAVYSLCKKGILRGYEGGTFRPNGNITREEFVTIIVRYLGLDTNAECSFDDVSENDWFYNSVAQAYVNNIVRGTSETSFGTGKTITRQDAAVILYNMGNVSSEGDINFKDKDAIAEYAVEAVKVLSDKGIISGNPDGTFKPKGELTRAQAAQLIYAYDMKKEDGR